VGLIGDSRDRSAAAGAAFAGPCRRSCSTFAEDKATLWPELRKLWEAAGARTRTWQEVFGASTATDGLHGVELRALPLTTCQAGKAEYPLPVFTNTWLVQPQDQTPAITRPAVRAAHDRHLEGRRAAIDINRADVHLRNFSDWAARFHRPNNPLFVPESYATRGGAATAFFGIRGARRDRLLAVRCQQRRTLGEPRPGSDRPAPTDLESLAAGPRPRGAGAE